LARVLIVGRSPARNIAAMARSSRPQLAHGRIAAGVAATVAVAPFGTQGIGFMVLPTKSATLPLLAQSSGACGQALRGRAQLDVRARKHLQPPRGQSVALPFIAGVACRVALKLLTGIKAFRRDLSSDGGTLTRGRMPELDVPLKVNSHAAARRDRTMSVVDEPMARRFWDYQKGLLKRGPRRLDRMYWLREEKRLFDAVRTSADVDFSEQLDVEVEKNGEHPKDKLFETFEDIRKHFELPEELVKSFRRCRYQKPTPVQKYSIPAALVGTDVMAIARKGSGKTLAYLTAVVARALNVGCQGIQEGPVCPFGLVLVPDRELCEQITDEACRLCFGTDLCIAPVHRGGDMVQQLKQIAEGADIVIATPDRLAELLEGGVLGLEKVRCLVLDEADDMLKDSGTQLRAIVQHEGMPSSGGKNGRQTMMFARTEPQGMKRIASMILDAKNVQLRVSRSGR